MSDYTKITEIKILSPNAKLKKLILENYPSIDEFAKEINIYPSTLKQYLRSSKLGSDKFKIKIVIKLDIDINSLYLSYKEQLSSYVYELNKNVRHYSTSHDLELLKELSELTLKNNMYTEHFIMVFNIGRFEYYKSNFEFALSYMDTALAYFHTESHSILRLEVLLYKAKLYAKQFHFKIDASVNENNIFITLKEADEVFCSLKKYTDKLQYRYYQITGYVYSLISEHQLALDYFNMSLINANTPIDKVKSMVHISNCESMLGNLNKSMALYSEILEITIDNKPVTNWIYLNISALYLKLGDYNMMDVYLSMVDPKSCYTLTYGFYFYYNTKFSAIAESGSTEKALELFDQFMDSCSLESIRLQDKIQVMNMLRNRVNELENDNEILKCLEKLIAKYIKSEQSIDEVLMNHLINLLGIINLKTLINL